jgi:hypothetical protein
MSAAREAKLSESRGACCRTIDQRPTLDGIALWLACKEAA